jgi:DNA-binding winged helix-turn-helix (wHTH) protein/TolB-like protein/tetratricopeptide (TPR) repeat protein
MGSPPPVRFGTFELDPGSGELRRNGRRVPLQGQPAQVLCQLVSHPGELVTRDDLRRALWSGDTFVEFDTALNVAINKIRQALQDSAAAPRFIETVPRRGYRFLADVRALEAVPAAAEDPGTAPPLTAVPTARRPVRFYLAGAAVVATLLSLFVAWRSHRQTSRASTPRSLAVLPFRPLIAQSGDEALQTGMAEAVIIRLGGLKQLRIPSLSTVMRHAARETDPLAAGRALGVETVLDGTLLRVNGSLRVSARLLDVEKGTSLWAQQWDLPWTDVFTVQDAMAAQVARALTIGLAPDQRATLRSRPTNVAAYDRYLRGRHLLTRGTIADSKRAAELLEEAVKVDPSSSAAYASLAFAYISIPLAQGPVTPYVSLGRQAALRAVELDPTLAEAHAVLGRIGFSFDWDVEAGERGLRRAVTLTPDDPFSLHCYSMLLTDEGRFDEALSLNERLLTQDPLSTLANRDRAHIFHVSRRYEDAIEQAKKTLELDSSFASAHWALWRSYERLGREQEAIEAYLQLLSLSPSEQQTLPALREAAHAGDPHLFWKRRMELLLARPDPPTYQVAMLYTKLGDKDRALAWLEKLYEQRSGAMRTLKVYPVWDPLRADPRFQDLMRRANVAAVPQPQRPSGALAQ